MAGHRFFVSPSQIDNEKAIITGDEAHHLQRVLRLGIGKQVTIFDGNGSELRAVIEQFNGKTVILRIIERLNDEVESPLAITLVQGLVKGEKFDFVIQKAVELGVMVLQPLISQHTDVQPNLAQAQNRLLRWQRIALEAAKQSGRRRLMTILAPVTWQQFIDSPSYPTILFAEHGGSSITQVIEKLKPHPLSAITAVVGSEGGWSEEELTQAASLGFYLVTIGRRILRAETAAIAITTLVQYLWGDLSSNSPLH